MIYYVVKLENGDYRIQEQQPQEEKITEVEMPQSITFKAQDYGSEIFQGSPITVITYLHGFRHDWKSKYHRQKAREHRSEKNYDTEKAQRFREASEKTGRIILKIAEEEGYDTENLEPGEIYDPPIPASTHRVVSNLGDIAQKIEDMTGDEELDWDKLNDLSSLQKKIDQQQQKLKDILYK